MAGELPMTEMDPARLHRQSGRETGADADLRLEQHARVEPDAVGRRIAGAAMDGDADARADIYRIADPPAEPGGGEMGAAVGVHRDEDARLRAPEPAQDLLAAPAELEIGPV